MKPLDVAFNSAVLHIATSSFDGYQAAQRGAPDTLDLRAHLAATSKCWFGPALRILRSSATGDTQRVPRHHDGVKWMAPILSPGGRTLMHHMRGASAPVLWRQRANAGIG